MLELFFSPNYEMVRTCICRTLLLRNLLMLAPAPDCKSLFLAFSSASLNEPSTAFVSCSNHLTAHLSVDLPCLRTRVFLLCSQDLKPCTPGLRLHLLLNIYHLFHISILHLRSCCLQQQSLLMLPSTNYCVDQLSVPMKCIIKHM